MTRRFASVALVAAASILTTAVVASSASAALSLTTLTAPFPASIAYPGYTDYTQVNLTTAGSLDWLRVGQDNVTGINADSAGYNEKLTGTILSGYSQTGVTGADTGSNHYLQYTDGTAPLASGSRGNEISSNGAFDFNAATSTTQGRELDVYVGALGNTTGTLTATLYNAAGAPIGSATGTLSSTAGHLAPAVFRIDYQGVGLGDVLHIHWAQTAGSGNTNTISLAAATVTVVPEPATLGSLAGGLIALAARRRRRAGV